MLHCYHAISDMLTSLGTLRKMGFFSFQILSNLTRYAEDNFPSDLNKDGRRASTSSPKIS